eukprot:scaffold34110_cov183-Amphora_coffeaeformis.AAC.1
MRRVSLGYYHDSHPWNGFVVTPRTTPKTGQIRENVVPNHQTHGMAAMTPVKRIVVTPVVVVVVVVGSAIPDRQTHRQRLHRNYEMPVNCVIFVTVYYFYAFVCWYPSWLHCVETLARDLFVASGIAWCDPYCYCDGRAPFE